MTDLINPAEYMAEYYKGQFELTPFEQAIFMRIREWYFDNIEVTALDDDDKHVIWSTMTVDKYERVCKDFWESTHGTGR